MKKNVNLDWELFEMSRVLRFVEYRCSIDDWGVNWYSLGDWLKNCGVVRELEVKEYLCNCRGYLKKCLCRLWILNNRLVRNSIGVYDEVSNEFMSGVCLIGREVNM